ncbi:hypothetical protein DFH06DRAFT_1299005 [Mycena polygramma]|nr:hypothetical protein DFH06DRAFT_1299005 [Mycena polygramma]
MTADEKVAGNAKATIQVAYRDFSASTEANAMEGPFLGSGLHLHGPPLHPLDNILPTLMDELWLPVAQIAALRGAILEEQPVKLDNDIDLSPLKLAQKAAQTLWNELPLESCLHCYQQCRGPGQILQVSPTLS